MHSVITSSHHTFQSNGRYSGTVASTCNVVPVPAAVWLFGSALGLIGVMRRRATA